MRAMKRMRCTMNYCDVTEAEAKRSSGNKRLRESRGKREAMRLTEAVGGSGGFTTLGSLLIVCGR